MQNKNKNKVKRSNASQEVALLKKKLKEMALTKRATPFTDAGGNIGSSVGGWLHPSLGNLGRHVGKFLGAGIGSIVGSGDYRVTGGVPGYNVFSGSVPQFKTAGAGNIVCHREYLGDVFSSTAFLNTPYPIQPGVAQSFPWLSTLAGSYQEYKIHGLVYEFVPMTTDYAQSGIPGYVVMGTNYNADAAPFINKQQMENSEYAVSTKPTQKLVHMVECARDQTVLGQLYTREGSVPVNQDLRLYDWGNFQLATGGASTLGTNIGELWCTYCVEFLKPILPLSSGEIGGADHYQRLSTTGATLWDGVSILTWSNTIGASVLKTAPTVSALQFPVDTIGFFMVTTYINGTAATIATPSLSSNASLIIQNDWTNHVYSQAQAPLSGSSGVYMSSIIVQCIQGPPGAPPTLTITGGNFPTAATIDIIISTLPIGFA